MSGTDWIWGTLPLLIVAIAIVAFFLKGIYLIGDDQVGVQTRRMGGQRMPQGQVIARGDQIGVQARTLVPGLYFRMPFIWQVERHGIIEVPEDKIGIVEAIDGLPLPAHRVLGDAVECNRFQDAEAFLEKGGFKGPQVDIMPPGKYRVNTRLFNVDLVPITVVNRGRVGTATALDGTPLPPDLLIAPDPSPTPGPEHPKARAHNYYQNGQAFLDSGGYRGVQLATLQSGKYYINPLLFTVSIEDVAEVPPGFVGVIRSNVGRELAQADATPTPVGSTEPMNAEQLRRSVERLLTTDQGKRGILRFPITPGKYNLNRSANTMYLVPTSAIMVDWASQEGANAATMSRPSTDPKADLSKIPYDDKNSATGSQFFRFSQLKVTSKDGFQLEVDVRMVIRVLPENAAFVIARFGSVYNLIQQIVHPLIDAEFRNSAGEKGALEFVQGRTALQQEALDKAQSRFAPYMVEAQNLLISYIKVDESLLATQTQKTIAIQQQAQYDQQAAAEERRIAVQEKTARANMQPQVVQAVLQVEINENNAKAAVKQSEGIRDSTVNKAEGDAKAIERIGKAQATAYQAQSDVIGAERVALVRVMEQVGSSHTKIVPDVLVTSGAESGSGNLLNTWLATMLAKEAAKSGGSAAPASPPPNPTPSDD